MEVLVHFRCVVVYHIIPRNADVWSATYRRTGKFYSGLKMECARREGMGGVASIA